MTNPRPATRPHQDDVSELLQVKALLNQAEALVDGLEHMIPKDGSSWLDWRTNGLTRRIEAAKKDVAKLADVLQVLMMEHHDAIKRAQR